MAMPERELDQAKRHPDVVKNIIKKDGRKDAIPYSPSNPPPAGNIWYATCSTASGTGAKTATTSTGDFVLATGSMVRILFTTSNTAANPTISIDGSTAKAIRPISSASGMANKIAAGEVIDLVYDGSNFVMTKGNAATTSFYGITKLNSSTSSTSTSEAATPSAVKDAYDLAASKASIPVAIADGGTGATSASAANVSLQNYNLLTGVQIASDTDLNTIVTPNIYRTTSDAITASVLNKPPVTQPFQLAVMHINTTSTVMQHVNEWLTGNEWRRFGYVSGGSWAWGAWVKISESLPLSVGSGGTGATTAQEALFNLGAYNLNRGTKIPNNSDLNDYKTIGVYYVLQSSDAATILHSPTSGGGFKLIVQYGAITSSISPRLFQWVLVQNTLQWYVRVYDGSAWGTWGRMLHTGDLPLSVGYGGTGATTVDGAIANLGFASGSSGNRYYTKFPDGTLVEYGYVSLDVTSNMSQIASSGVYYVSATLNFLTSFLNADYSISGNVRYSTGYAVPIGFTPINASSALIHIYDFYARAASSTLYVLRYEAIGRWK